MDEVEQFVLKKIEIVESKLENHVEKIGAKLDQLVEIMRTVAQLQEREARNSEDIVELRKSLRESMDNYTRAVTRIHERLDKNEDEQKKQEKEIVGQISEVAKAIEHRIEKIEETEELKREKLETDVREVENKLNTWLNRGIGAWAAASVLLLVIQAIGGYLLNNMKDEFNAARQQITTSERRLSETEQNVNMVWQELRRGSTIDRSDSHR
jgi:uncharacterized phage infection (PIP) family protein YhgE